MSKEFKTLFDYLKNLQSRYFHALSAFYVIVNFAGSNIKKLSQKDFLEFHQGRTFLSELFKQYKAMDNKDLAEIKNKISSHEKIIKKIDDYRNQYLAHEDKKKKEIIINSGEIQKLFKLIADILNLFSSRLDFSTTAWEHVEKECKGDTKRVVEYLKRFEPYRLQEIEKKYNLRK